MLSTRIMMASGNTSMPIPIFWLKANEIVGLVDNDPIATWPNKGSGNSTYNATESNADLRPIYKTNIINGLPCAYFNNSGMITALNPGSFFTVFTVYASNVTGFFYGRVLQGSDNWIVGPCEGFQTAYNGNFLYGPAVNTNFVISSFITTVAGAVLRINGSQVDSNGSTNGPGTLGLGEEGSTTGNIFTGYLAEVMLYLGTLSAPNILSIESYLRTKYAL